jgi:hypothetical protein
MFFKISAIILSVNFFQNPEEFLQGIFFVREQTKGQTWVSGSLNWAKAGRHFKLETCPQLENEKDCFIWKELEYFSSPIFLNHNSYLANENTNNKNQAQLILERSFMPDVGNDASSCTCSCPCPINKTDNPCFYSFK